MRYLAFVVQYMQIQFRDHRIKHIEGVRQTIETLEPSIYSANHDILFKEVNVFVSRFNILGR